MASSAAQILRYLQRLGESSGLGTASDAELMERFCRCKDEAAFTALVGRHGPMVLRVCRGVLADTHAVEDAFQATFLILARGAGSVRRPGSLAAWLHGVAYRVAVKARAAQVRRRLREPQGPAPGLLDPHPDPLAELTARELVAIVDEEVGRLPEVYRLPVILCCLEGRTVEESARQLGWTSGAVRGRLRRGRARLHTRLMGRGLELPAALVAVEVARGGAWAGVPAALAANAAKVALAFAAGPGGAAGAISAKVIALAEAGLHGMAVAKAKLGLALLLAAGLTATGAGALTYQVLGAKPLAAKQEAGPKPLRTSTERPRPREEKQQARTDRYGDPLPDGAITRIGTVRLHHPRGGSSTAFSPDGKTIARPVSTERRASGTWQQARRSTDSGITSRAE